MDPFIGEIRICAFTFAPYGWAFCNGQIMQIVQNTALFSLLGSVYGGDGKTTFCLPNLQGRAPMHPGNGPNLTPRRLGDSGGTTTVLLNSSHLPSHSHALQGSTAMGTTGDPTGNVPALVPGRGANLYTKATTPVVPMKGTIGSAGGDLAHNNMQPFLAVNFCIALSGIYPARQ